MKNKLLVLLFLLVGINLNAAEITWVNAFPIYTYGDVTAIAKVYEFINNIVNSPTPQIIMGIGVTMAIVISGWKVKDGDYNEIIKALFAPITLYALFFVPTVNVHITDLRVDKGLINYSVPDGGYRKVDNVPYAIAFIPASSSMLVSLFIDLIDNSWDATSVGSKFSTLGFQEMSHISQVALTLGTFDSLDVNTSSDVYNMRQYVNQCLVVEALKTPSNDMRLAKPNKPFPEMYDPANFADNQDGPIANLLVQFTDANGNTTSNRTCATLYNTYVVGVASTLEDAFKDVLQAKFPNVDITSSAFGEAWRENAGVDQILVGNIRKAMITGAASRALAKDLSTDGIGVDGVAMATEIAIEKTIANLRTEGLAKYEWTARMLPQAVFIIMMLMLGIFPLMIIVMTFMGFNAFKGVANFFMGYIAMNFNLVSLALVSNIISYYTAQNAQNAIASYQGMPFGMTQISEFMYQQADMAGLAGIIGTISVPFVTAAIFYGETKGLAAGISGVTGAFRGNVDAEARDMLVGRDTQNEIDKQILDDAKHERDAASWLTQEGFTKPSNMSAVEAKNQMMKNLSSIGNANAASEIFHSGNAQNFISGSAKQSSQGFNKTAGFGDSNVSMETAGSVSFEDGEVMGSMIQKTSDLRSESESYDTSKVGEGQAIGMFGKDMGSAALSDLDSKASATVANATNATAMSVAAGRGLLQTGAFNSDGTLSEGNPILRDAMTGAAMQSAGKLMSLKGMGDSIDGDIESNGFVDYMKGSEFQGRNGANKTIADGEKWQSLGDSDNDPDKVALMKKVKQNEVANTFGGIESANAEIMEHGGVDGAIKDMITSAQEKGIGSATHADNLREKYGSNLKGANAKGMTLSETMSAIDMSKLDSQEGQAAGVLANKGINPDMYSDNAMYGEMSKQQSTQAKLDAQGGIGGAVGIDVTEASIKAGTQKGNVEESSKILENAIKSGAAEGAKTLSDAAAKIAEVQTGMQMGSTAGLMKKFSDPEALKKTLEDNGYKDAAKELEGMSAGDMAAWVSSKQAGHMTGMHGLALRNDKGEMTSVGVSLGDDGARAMTVDSSFKDDSSRSKISGSTETFNNDVKKLNNTDPLATLAINRFGGDMQKAAEYARSADGAKWMMDPRNELSLAAAEAGHQIAEATGMSGEGAALISGGLAGGGLALAIGNKMTKQPIKFNENQLSQLSQVTDDKGNIQGYEDSKGNKVADKDGYAVNKSGKRIESGVVKRAWNGLQNKGVDLVSSLTGNSTIQEEANTNSNKNNNSTSNHNKSPNINSNTIIPKSEQQSKDYNSGGKPSTIAEGIDEVTTAQRRNAEMSNLQQTRDNLLNVAESPEAKERINNDFETRSQAIKDKYPTQMEKAVKHQNALDAATNKMLEDNKFAKPNKNFKNLTNVANASKAIGEGIIFGEVMGDAPKHSINEGDYNMARLQAAPNNVLSGATSAVMSAVASTGNILDAVNPFGSPFNNMSNKYLGTNLSTVSTQLLNQSADSFGNAWQNVSNLGSDSHNVAGYTNAPQANTNVPSIHNPTAPAVPQHVQTAFSTPSGFNTQQAISTSTGFSTNAAGQEIYGANKNDTLFRNDTSAESLRIQEDIALGTEFNQETSEGIQAAVERLMDADRTDNKE